MKAWIKAFPALAASAALVFSLAACTNGGSGAASATASGSTSTASAASAEDNTPKDVLSGSWKQTDDTNGNWTWTFDGKGKCHLNGETTGFDSDGTYVLDESAKKVTVTMDSWSEPKEYSYTLTDTTLDLDSKYSSYKLIKR